jgi:CrcB protein
LGGALRHRFTGIVVGVAGTALPWGIMSINIIDAAAMRLVIGRFAMRGEGAFRSRLFLATGVLGGFTTFSAFSLDAVLLYKRGQAGLATLYVIASVLLSIAGLVIGLFAMRSLPL